MSVTVEAVVIVSVPLVASAAVVGGWLLARASGRQQPEPAPCPECSGTANRHEAWCEYGEAMLFTAPSPPVIQAGGGFRAVDAGSGRRTRQRLDESTAALNSRPLGHCDSVLPLHPRTGPTLRVVHDVDRQERAT